MAIFKVVVQLPPTSGRPEDTVNNDFYFKNVTPASYNPDQITSIVARLTAFYNSIPTGETKQISDYLGRQVSRSAGAAKFLIYTVEDGDLGQPWGSPKSTNSWTVGVVDSGDALPAEIACVLSYHGDLTDIPETEANPSPPPAIIRPAARRRGRLYIGPLQQASGSAGGDDLDWQPGTVFRDTLAGAATDLLAASGTEDVTWVNYSSTALETHAVTGGFVDNAYDVQRRRGTEASSRDTWGT